MYLPVMPWSLPVHGTFHNGSSHTFSSVLDALDFLENETPRRPGSRYQSAVQTCRRALQRMTPGVALEIFISGCLKAGLPVNGTAAHYIDAPRNDESQPVA